MPIRFPRTILTLAILVFLLTGLGCGTSTIKGSLVLEAGDHAAIRAKGSHPLVILDNHGPGDLELTFLNEEGEVQGKESLVATAFRSKSSRGFAYWRIVNSSDQPANLDFEVRATSGISIQQNVDTEGAQEMLDAIDDIFDD